ncbi:amidase [Actinomadura sp. HBU206391]|uniref:amidase n=1 Tax=Actinomadura sp. HBU206391 TaxID=2731692 RepID=UPI00164FB83C|nr:amidase family protein [Actinomadura sp. HBU206391]MBC6459034.1 amidase [Actinomadura sp. HBU206391]
MGNAPSARRLRRVIALVTAAGLSGTLVTPPAADASPHRPSAPPQVAGLGLDELRVLLKHRRLTSVQLVREYLRRIEAYDHAYGDQPGLSAVIAVNQRAQAEAARLDAERRAGRIRGPLHGIPIVVKDNFDTADMPTTSGSVALRDLRPRDDAEQVRRLRAAGAIVLAKTNMHEFAMNIYTISSLGGQTRNPYDQTRHPGGSSGGTGAAVGAGFAPAGMGTDTCGSIRIPAAHNNLVGLRPTLGLSSRDGVAPLAGTQDTAGPLATSVRDVALILDATVGHDPKDPVTRESIGRIPRSYLPALRGNALRGKRIGIFTDYFGASAEEQPTTDLVRAAADDMVRQGARTVELGPQPELLAAAAGANRVRDEFERDLNAYLAAARGRPSELAGLEPPYDEITLADIATSGQVTPTVLSTLKAWVGSPALPNDAYDEKLRQRGILQDGLKALMRDHDLDALLYPSITRPATTVGTTQPYANCRLAGYSGFPALSVPAGFTADGLPVGVELLGLPYSEPGLLGMGHAYEQATGHRRLPAGTPPLPAETR